MPFEHSIFRGTDYITVKIRKKEKVYHNEELKKGEFLKIPEFKINTF